MRNKKRESGQKAWFAAEIIVHIPAHRQAETTHESGGEGERAGKPMREGERKKRAEKALLFPSKLCYTAMKEKQNRKRIYEQKEILVF
jgi:hypothetical protein